MSNFTFGKWEYEEYIPYGITLNGTEYLVRQGETDIALVKREEDARLITAAPELYWMAYNLLFELKRGNGANPEYIAQAIPQIEELLKRIQGDTATLKPCPFCGGEAVVQPEGMTTCGYWITCSECGVEQTQAHETVEQAADEWNRRAQNG